MPVPPAVSGPQQQQQFQRLKVRVPSPACCMQGPNLPIGPSAQNPKLPMITLAENPKFTISSNCVEPVVASAQNPKLPMDPCAWKPRLPVVPLAENPKFTNSALCSEIQIYQ